MKKYEVAVSFAGEDRQIAEQIALELKRRGVSVFYDKLEQADLWGKDLYQHLSNIYSSCANYCLVFVSKQYVKKKWTKVELRSAQARAFEQEAEYILPIRLDDTVLPGIPPTVGYLDANELSVEEIVNLLLEKLGYHSTLHVRTSRTSDVEEEILFWKVRSVVNSADPIQLFPMAPTDEYDPEIKEITQLILKAKSQTHLAHLTKEVFDKWFSPSLAGPIEKYLSMAHELWLIKDDISVSRLRGS